MGVRIEEKNMDPGFRVGTTRGRGITVWSGTSDGRRSLDSNVSQMPPNIHPCGLCHTEVRKILEQQKLEGKLFFVPKQLLECPPSCGLEKLDGMIITYQIFYRELKLFNFTKGLIISFHFIHILCQVLNNKEKGRKRRQDKIRREMSTVSKETHH